MGFLLDSFDKTVYEPVYQNRAVSTEESLEYVFSLNTELEEVFVEQYIKIPHSITAIFTDGKQVRIDTERSFDEHDPYIDEESLLAPPEAQVDRFWRRKATRLTYLVSQVFLSLLTGELCGNYERMATDNLINAHSQQEIDVLKQFFATGLAEDHTQRYQRFTELTDSLLCLEHRLSLSSYHHMGSNMATSRNLPNMKEYYEGTGKIALQTHKKPSRVLPEKYEILIWNHLFQKSTSVIVERPARVIIGRKAGGAKELTTARRESIDKGPLKVSPQIDKEVEKKGEVNYYILGVEGDKCLSRKHVEISLPESASHARPEFQDMGSTHGLVVFQDSTCNLTNSKVIFPGGKGTFPCPEDQFIKLGNTYARIRPLPAMS